MRKSEGYVFTTTKDQRKEALNKSINRRMAKRFESMSTQERFFLTTLFL